jgi:acyl-CoA:acyl-CoA alkyltransferase
MRFEHVAAPAFAHVLPERALSSDELEQRLAPVYERLKLARGRIELMSGIRERRFFEPAARPSEIAARAGAKALAQSGIARAKIGTLIHAAVSRDFLEPATASLVHHALELDAQCQVFDLSNACLGFANAMTLVASQIERGEIEAGLIVSGEDGAPLVEGTVATLNALAASATNAELRDALKRAFASLTIGAGGAACVLARDTLFPDARRFLGGSVLAATEHHVLCHGDRMSNDAGLWMQTDSEALLHAGNALAQRTWRAFEAELGWRIADVERIVTHQVGVAHRRLTLGSIGLDTALDFPTVERLGNIGSVSLPLSFALAEEQGFIRPGQRVAMLGIGSGLHCMILGLR